MKKLFLIAIVSFVALATMSFTAGKGVTLRLRPSKDKAYVITSKTTQTTAMKIQGQTMRSSQTIEGRQTFTAKEVSANANVFETQIDVITMNISTMGMNMSYDSEHPENTSPMIADQAKSFDDIIKKPSTITYDELGHNTNSENMEMSQLTNIIIELPEEELKEGSQWNYVKSQKVSDNDVNINMTYTVTGISKKSVELSLTGTIDTKGITGTYNGTASIDPQTGLIMASTISNSLSMTVSEQGMEIPMTITGTTTISVKE